jgi:hypothetical protein
MLSVSKFIAILPCEPVARTGGDEVVHPPLSRWFNHYIPGRPPESRPTCCVRRVVGEFPGTARIGPFRHGVSPCGRSLTAPTDTGSGPHKYPRPGVGDRAARRPTDGRRTSARADHLRPALRHRARPERRREVRARRERDATLDAASSPNRLGQRPDSSVVEHLHGKEKVKSSILFRGSDSSRHLGTGVPRRGSSGG